MPEHKDNPAEILGLTTLADREPAEAVDWLGTRVDIAWDANRQDLLRHLAMLAGTISRSNANPVDVTLLDYYLGNLWNGARRLAGPFSSGSWEWDQYDLEGEVVCLRRAIRSSGFSQLPATRRCQILTNLGNCLDNTGRFVEAVEMWNDALAIEPRFGMARGNRALGLLTYARSVYDHGHTLVMAGQAWRELDPSALHALEPGAGEYFAAQRSQIEKTLPPEVLKNWGDLDAFSLGDTEAEVNYRTWCLQRRLFLNPLNDMATSSIAAQDVLTAPSIVAPIGEGPRFHGFFNQIKQEFCSARWLVYEATNSSEAHLSDRDVLLYNTLDYPSYSLATERLKLAFRSLYSLFDKIAFFLNAYLGLEIPDRNVSFRGIWYSGQNKQKGLRPEFKERPNLPLRGLFWLGKDLYEEKAEFRSAIDPDAERLNEIRNHLEHKYLKLHLDLWQPTANASKGLIDDLAMSLYKAEFERMTTRLLSLVRAAIIYLSLGVHREEGVRAAARPASAITPPMILDVWEDDWKQ